MKQPTYYITRKGTAINANKMGTLSPFLPDRRTLEMHVLNERTVMQLKDGYTPQPLFIKVETNELHLMLEEVKRKLKGFILDHIPLRLQTNNLPIVIITKKEEDDAKDK